jgi:hypothetical protein
MIVITRRALREHTGYSVWRPQHWHTPFFAKIGGQWRVRKAKLLLKLPFGFGVFWAHGREWAE